MTHLFGTYIPENKGLYISLTNIYGLGTKQVINICKSIGINPKVSDYIIKNIETQMGRKKTIR